MFSATEFNARNVVKYIVSSAVTYKLTQPVKAVLVDHTNLDEDGKPVEILVGVIGWGIHSSVKPYTDRVVDGTADRIVAYRENRRAKKTEKSEKSESE